MGASFTGVTVTLKVVDVVFVPSVTLSVITMGPPLRFAAGVIVTVRDAPVPAKTILPLGMSVVLAELPDTIKLAAASSGSPTVKPKATVVPSSGML